MEDSEERTKDYKNGTLNVCICYNSKHEIFEACESLAAKHALGKVKKINSENFEKELYGGKNVKPDILIRTSNEVRLSNFLLYQTDESQFHFVKVLWPDFSLWDFIKIICEY
jgi:undecaprenyl diphosphate synthase